MSQVKSRIKIAVFLCLSLVLIRGEAGLKHGPFPIKRSPIAEMTYTFVRKLEVEATASQLASSSIDGTIKLLNDVVIAISETEMKTYRAGTVLNPTLNPSDDILIPAGVTVSNPASVDGSIASGRFAYLGNAPRFQPENLEMVASKMGHSLRVKAWVSQDTIDGYELALLTRFKGFYDSFMLPTMHFEILESLVSIAKNTQNVNTKKWATVASYYSKHFLENQAVDIYSKTSAEDQYKEIILTSMLRKFMNDETLDIQSGLDLYEQYQADSNFITTRREKSAELFNFHLGTRYTLNESIEPLAVPRIGFLTFVYPIAIDKEGPFELPTPGLREFPLRTSIEARWWSNRWLDEFGGFPFLQITEDGVAFHGPITMNNAAKDTWYLRRDNVSHSCMRMDPSDLLELRALIPKNMNQLESLGKTIPLQIIEWPDVTDINGDGLNEVMDVAYYSLPVSGASIVNPVNWKANVYNKVYWEKHFKPYSGLLESKNTFRVVQKTTVDKKTGAKKIVNRGEFTGLPIYEMVEGELSIVGYHSEVTPIYTYPQRPTSIIQYREDGVEYKDGDKWGGDTFGKFPPGYFNKL